MRNATGLSQCLATTSSARVEHRLTIGQRITWSDVDILFQTESTAQFWNKLENIEKYPAYRCALLTTQDRFLSTFTLQSGLVYDTISGFVEMRVKLSVSVKRINHLHGFHMSFSNSGVTNQWPTSIASSQGKWATVNSTIPVKEAASRVVSGILINGRHQRSINLGTDGVMV